MDYTYLKARAKINVALDVLSKRADGYHEMQMVMQTLTLYDGVFIKKTEKSPLKLACNVRWLPTDERNLVYKAAKLLIDEYHIQEGVFIELTKNIPVSAGLGGGSSDCAATLVGMRKLFELPISDTRLREIGKSLGADVPYCLMRGTALAEGIGEKLTLLDPHPSVFVLLAKPPIAVSTAAVFRELNLSKIQAHPDINQILSGIRRKDLKLISGGMGNVLEEITAKKFPIIDELKQIMMSVNALGALMSGSGPTVFGYFKSKSDAYKAIGKITENLPGVREVILTSIYNPILRRNENRNGNGKHI